ncbi:MAG: CPBP family intramembrane metalloprotease [Euryarchaeota archaeon]|nr:CPBP family intramembrane metalloprotease [Euryarchaeota archaeon]
MNNRYTIPVLGYLTVLIASILTPILFNNESLHAMVLFPLILIFVFLTKMDCKQFGLIAGRFKEYELVILYTTSVCLLIVLLAAITGNLEGIKSFSAIVGPMATLFFTTLILTVTTEEGFFRGWLYGIMDREGFNVKAIIFWTALAFSLWHIPLFILNKDFAANYAMIPFYLTGAFVGGLIYGLFRYRSGSIIVTSLGHTIWNTLAYTFFGSGTKIGPLGITMTNIYDPERGILGLILNIVFLVLLWYFTFHMGVSSEKHPRS